MKEIWITIAEIAIGVGLFAGLYLFFKTNYPTLLQSLWTQITSF